MSTLAQPPTAWTTRRWLTTISLLLLLHVGLIFALAKRIPGHFHPAENKTTDFRLAAPDFSTSLLEKLPAADPTVFVLPSRTGFSGRSWLGVKPVEYEAPDWSEPPRWLALNAGKLGLAAADFEPASTLPPLQINEKLSPLETSDPYALVPPLQQSSLMQLEGGLALRKLREQPVLPSWTYSDPLTNSVVQIAADNAGLVVSARLLSRSRLPEADKTALQLASRLRFEPVNGPPQLIWGKVIFIWQTLPMPATNTVNGSASTTSPTP